MSRVKSAPTIRTSLPAPALHRITVDEYERIIAAGALENPSGVELIDGYVVEKIGKNAERGYATKQALKAFEARLHKGWTWRKEEPVRIPAFDEPEPDLAIIRGSDADYEHRIPTAADVALLVEVSGSTLIQDRGKKGSAYAASGVPVYWIINLVNRQVEVYSKPGATGYRLRKDYLPGQQIPLTIGGRKLLPIPVDDLLPSSR